MLILILASSIAFDTNMTKQELKDTGLSKLTIEERVNLREWIEEHYAKKLISQNKESGSVLQEVLKNGQYIRLSDQSLWEINPNDTLITQSWITAVEIKISEGKDKDYPYILTNSLTGSSIKARKAQKVT